MAPAVMERQDGVDCASAIREPQFFRPARRRRASISTALLEELAEVLIRPAPAKRLAALGRTARQVLADYVEATELVTPLAVPSVVTADPDDDHVIAAALGAKAELIVSGDRDLLALGAHQDIRIVTPAQALRLLAIP